MSLLLLWRGSTPPPEGIEYVEVFAVEVELNKVMAIEVEMNKIVTIDTYAELEDNS